MRDAFASCINLDANASKLDRNNEFFLMKNKEPIRIKTIRDDPCVKVVGGDIEKAIRILKQKTLKAGTFKILKERKYNPSPADRRRYKKQKALARLMRKNNQQKI
jgi:ribosomal protein S21